jgi:hypothetical protein
MERLWKMIALTLKFLQHGETMEDDRTDIEIPTAWGDYGR